jgi:hypothetical protein
MKNYLDRKIGIEIVYDPMELEGNRKSCMRDVTILKFGFCFNY